ncbi:aldehyde dehydrogenase [Cochleicola gelatinilyticus]|uniref:Aldehyde dehydrogenase n=1 Tax=Cochleicola gelatinilyticus TaxID=1763537 RepID=A0A167HRH1_9FLAO|nr:aldehyde dehydrogenase [Cochleicola gelatinilyticus]OAB78887.1 aldehyde dehydrogenase [Cochleicola gelatinilyticus]
MQTIISLQRAFYNSQATKKIAFRREQLETLERMLTENEAALDDAIYKDFKKSAFENYVSELALLYHDIKQAKRNLKRWTRKKKVSTNLMNFPASSYMLSEPLGVCLVMGAWNYPYQLSFAPIVAAIAAGNTIVLKPSELPANTSSLMAKLVADYFRPEFFTVIEGGIPETTALLKQKFDKIFFTGSTKVGKIVYKAAAENLTPVTLEMGGKSPTFVTEEANIKMTAKRMVWAKFLNAGQTCIAPDYVLVHASIQEKLLEALKAEIIEAHYAFENNNYLQIINEDHMERLQKMMVPKKIYFGGEIHKETRYIQPTILKDVTFNDVVMEEEIFGPILPVIPYVSLEEAIEKVNTLPKPLACYVFTENKKQKSQILKSISFGGGAVNDAVMHITNPNLPFGGVGDSGIGSYHGKAGFDAFTHYKSVLEKPTWLEFPLKYYPYSASKLKWLKRLMKLQ